MKAVYSANTEAAGKDALEDFGKTWNEKYPMIHKSKVTKNLSSFSADDAIPQILYLEFKILQRNGQCRLGIEEKQCTNFQLFTGIESRYDISRFT